MQKTWTWSVTSGPLLSKNHAEKQHICQQAGLSGIEPTSDFFAAVPPGQLQGLVSEYRDAGVSFDSYHLSLQPEDDIACFYETMRLQAVDTLKREMEQAAQVGARVVIQHPSTNRFSIEAEGGIDPYLRQIGKSLEALLPHAAGLDLITALENMLPGEDGPRVGAQAEHFELFIEKFGDAHLGFCLDTGHALVAGGPQGADAFHRVMAPHMAAYHLADNAGDRDSHLAPGHGLVDWTTAFRRATEIGYAHSMCIETPPFAHGPNYSMEAWKNMVQNTDVLVEQARSA